MAKAKEYWVEQFEVGEGLPLNDEGAKWQYREKSDRYDIKTRKGWLTVHFKDWIVKIAKDNFQVYKPKEFNEAFELL